MGRDTIQLDDAVSTISGEYLLEFTSEYGIPEDLHPELPGPEDTIVDFPEGKVGEVDINKKTENQAKMTKLSMEWKRLCKIKAKVQKCQSQSQYRRISSQTGAGTEEYYWMQS
ncbi:hypothetical protein Tco_1037524 [Tanacetum coccineum]